MAESVSEVEATNPMLLLDEDQLIRLESVLQSPAAKDMLEEVLSANRDSPTVGAGTPSLVEHIGSPTENVRGIP